MPSFFAPVRPTSARWRALAAILALAACLAALSFYRRWRQGKFDRLLASDDGRSRLAKAYLVSSFHFVSLLFVSMSWPFVAPQSWDWFFMLSQLARMASYHFTKGECLINYHEKRLLEDPNYQQGSQPFREPYTDNLPTLLRYAYVVALVTLVPYVMFVVFANKANYPRPLRPAAWAIAAAVTLWGYNAWIRFSHEKLRQMQQGQH